VKIKKYLPYLGGIIVFVVILAIYFSRNKVIQYTPTEKPTPSPEVKLPEQKEPVSTKVKSPAEKESTQNLSKEKSTNSSKMKIAPNFSLWSLNGKIISLSDFKGKVIILDFWATWCPPCREEIPHFVNLYERYRDEGFQILGVVLDENKNVVENFAKNYHINYSLLFPDEKILKAYGPIIYIPTTFVISSDGYIYKKYIGYNPESVFEDDIKKLLKEK